MNVPYDFAQLLKTYKDNYASYRVTGNISQKAISDAALDAIKRTIQNGEKALEEQTKMITEFTENYTKDNPAIVNLHARSKSIKKVGPALENEYTVSKQRTEAPQAQPVTDSRIYLKGAVVVGLIIIVGIVGAL